MIFHSNRKSHDIRVVSEDKIANHRFLTEDLKLRNAKFVLDEYHLINHILPEQLGLHYHNFMSADLISMVRSKNALELSKHYDKCLAVLRHRSTRNYNLEQKLKEFSDEKVSYAHYILDETVDTMGRHGSTTSDATTIVF